MPNWCMNTLVLKHDNPSMIKRVEDAFAAGRLLSEFIPNTGDPDDWYSHNITEWGTKWDIGAPDGINDIRDNSIVLYFDSAWSPPTKAYKRLQEMGFEIEAMYYEPGIAFCGIWVDVMMSSMTCPIWMLKRSQKQFLKNLTTRLTLPNRWLNGMKVITIVKRITYEHKFN